MAQTLLNREQVNRLLRSAVANVGTQKEFGLEHNIAPSLVSMVLSYKQYPGPALLDALGLEKVTYYRRKKDRE